MKYAGLVLLLVIFAGCATVTEVVGDIGPDYGDVPEQALVDVAREIEAAVSAGDRDRAVASRDGIVLETEEIAQAIRTRAARHHLVNTLLDSGYAWEENNGLIAILRSQEYKKNTTSQQRDRDALIVLSENNDRWAIYEGIRKASKLPPSSLNTVQQAFYRARIEFLAPGQKYEDASGEAAVK